jgi:hypothetical protein
VLTHRYLKSAEGAEDDAQREGGQVAAEDPDSKGDDPGEHGQLGEGEASPRRRWTLVDLRLLAQRRPRAARLMDIPTRF